MCIVSGMADPSFQYNSYRTLPPSSGSAGGATAVSTDQTDPDGRLATLLVTAGTDWMYSSVQKSIQAEPGRVDQSQELHDYLDSPLVSPKEKRLDLVGWWGVSHVAIALALADANSSPSSIPSRNRPFATQLLHRSPHTHTHSRHSVIVSLG